MYKVKLATVEVSTSNPYIYYHMQLQDIIKSGRSAVAEDAAGGPTLASYCGRAPGLCRLTHWVSPPGTDPATPLTMKKFVSHTTCHDSLELHEQEAYLVMGQTSDLWRVKSECVGDSCCPGAQAQAPFPNPARSLMSKVLLHVLAGVLDFRVA